MPYSHGGLSLGVPASFLAWNNSDQSPQGIVVQGKMFVRKKKKEKKEKQKKEKETKKEKKKKEKQKASSVQFSSRWYLCAWKSPYALHPVSQKFPQSRP